MWTIFSENAFLVLILCHATLSQPWLEHAVNQKKKPETSGNSLYKKSTHKSRSIGEASNMILAKFRPGFEDFTPSFFHPEACYLEEIICDPLYKYRTYDGSCNNLLYPHLGSPYTTLDRLLPAKYEDGFNEPRGGYKSRLPNTRLVSTTIHPDLVDPDPTLTHLIAIIGQWVDHDLSFAPEDNLKCCSTGKVHPDCWDIELPENDSFYSTVNQTCLDFTRSTAYCFPGQTGMREQMNGITGFLDNSNIYGSDANRAHYLRLHEYGRLRENNDTEGFLPTIATIEEITGEEIEILGHYAAGDDRVNEHPALTAMHTLFLREHNRLAYAIAEAYPGLSDEEIFQMARRLTNAQWQKIVYGEYLPIILGSQTMAKYGLTIVPGEQTEYNPMVKPTILQEFSTCAYRFGHSLINGLIKMMQGSETMHTFFVRDAFFNHSQINYLDGQGFDMLLNGMTQQNAQTFDRYVSEDLSNFVLREPGHDYGSDLMARNIKRGRDHGMRPYADYRKICYLPALTTWEERPQEIPADAWAKFESLYDTPQDIDLFPAGLAENHVPGGVSGPTFNCLKAIQFHRTKYGDRFFWTHKGQAGSFTPEQVAQIYARTIGDIICENTSLTRVPTNALRPVSPSNPWQLCGNPNRALNVSDFILEDYSST